jgi:hypothetical protein
MRRSKQRKKEDELRRNELELPTGGSKRKEPLPDLPPPKRTRNNEAVGPSPFSDPRRRSPAYKTNEGDSSDWREFLGVGQMHGPQQLRVPARSSLAALDGLSIILNIHPTIGPSQLPVKSKRMRESTPELAARKRARESTLNPSARQQAHEMADLRPHSEARLPGDPTSDGIACESTPDLIAHKPLRELVYSEHEFEPEYAPKRKLGITPLPSQTIRGLLQRKSNDAYFQCILEVVDWTQHQLPHSKDPVLSGIKSMPAVKSMVDEIRRVCIDSWRTQRRSELVFDDNEWWIFELVDEIIAERKERDRDHAARPRERSSTHRVSKRPLLDGADHGYAAQP